MSRDLDILLDKCIDRMNEGASLENCIAEHPEHAEELEPLLRALCDARDACSDVPRATAKSVARRRLGAALVNSDGSVQIRHWRSSPLSGWSRKWAIMAVVLMMALIGFGLFWALKPGTSQVLANIKPTDGSIVDVSTITIWGQTLPDALVLINWEIADMDSEGNFSLLVTLNEGPNVLHIIVTDVKGNFVTAKLTVSFVPSHSNNVTKITAQPNAPLMVIYDRMDNGRI
jgi:hypothetical protein